MLDHHTLGRIAGIPIRANLLQGYLIALWFIWGASRGAAGETLWLIVLAMGLLLVHELAHAIVARRMGLHVTDVVLGPIGMARISDMPESPRIEAWVAAAGPLSNLVLAAISAPLLLAFPASPGPRMELLGLGFEAPNTPLELFVVLNLAYGLVNLIPAFPLDGGRLLRAFLARGGRSWVDATNRATRFGSLIAWATIIFSLLDGKFLLVLLGFFILWTGLRERWSVRLRHHAASFGMGGAQPGAAGRFAGWEELLRQRTGAAGAPLGGDPDETAPPREDPVAPPRTGGAKGFSDEDIERLENFRGRLQRPAQD